MLKAIVVAVCVSLLALPVTLVPAAIVWLGLEYEAPAVFGGVPPGWLIVALTAVAALLPMPIVVRLFRQSVAVERELGRGRPGKP